MSFVVTSVVLGAAVANAGTVTVPYPAGTNQASFTGANAAPNTGAAVVNDNDFYPEAAAGVRVNLAYGGSNVTLTNNTGVTWPIGATVRVQFGQAGNDRPGFIAGPAITSLTGAVGTPSDAVADVSAAFVQATLNNNFATLRDKINVILIALRANGTIQ